MSNSAHIEALNQFERRLEESRAEDARIVPSDGKFGPKTTDALKYGKALLILSEINSLVQKLKTMFKDDKASLLLAEIDLRIEELKTILKERREDS